MTPEVSEPEASARLARRRATERGLAFLAERQMSSGQFPIYMIDLTTGEEALDPSPFATALIVHCLGSASHPLAKTMCTRAVAFLRAEMEPGSVWRHWAADHPRRKWIPHDVDDTACASHALRQQGLTFPDNRSLLLANRDARGLFYTWLTPRLRPFPLHLGFWRIAAPRWLNPVRSFLFWRYTEASRRDVDCVVNANVLLYLGAGPDVEQISGYLIDALERGDEERCDKWYLSAITFYYAVSRCLAAGVSSLEPARELMVGRILAAARPDGSIGGNALETALAACALRNCGADGVDLVHALDWLAASQGPTGSWPTANFYWGGPLRFSAFGSEELTTAFCLASLLPAADVG